MRICKGIPYITQDMPHVSQITDITDIIEYTTRSRRPFQSWAEVALHILDQVPRLYVSGFRFRVHALRTRVQGSRVLPGLARTAGLIVLGSR